MTEVTPPKWAERFLRWYCHPKFLEEIEGDIYELFDRRVLEGQKAKARRKFVWDVIRFFRWSNIKRSNSKLIKMNQLVLFSNYLKLGLRNIKRNLVTSSINIFGLAISIGISITTMIFVDLQYNMDQIHAKGDRIYQITNHVQQENDTELWSDSPILLGPALVKDFPEVEAFCRIEFGDANVRYGSNVFEEDLSFVDPSFLHIFDYPLLDGDRGALKNKTNVVISWDMAIKYFRDENPVGEELAFKFPNGKIKRFQVGAVLAPYPYNTLMKYEFLLPIDNFYDLNPEKTYGWEYMTDATIALMREGAKLSPSPDGFDQYKELQLGSDPEWKIASFEAIPWKDISLRGYDIRGAITGGSHPAGRVALVIISGLLLGMACFNFMNIAIAASTKRLKEIALRKAMGGIRKQIVYQFLVENVLTCFFALVVGTFLAYFFFVPGFDMLIPPLNILFRTGEPITMVIFYFALLVVIGLLSGAYPAFYISKFQPVAIFRGSLKLGSSNVFSKVLLGFQMLLAFITIVGSLLFLNEGLYNKDRDWGYNYENTFSVLVPDSQKLEQLKSIIENHSDVISVTTANGQIGGYMPTQNYEHLDKQFRMRSIRVSENYFETAGLRMKDGRVLSNSAFDQKNAVVINETFAEYMEWSNPINERIVHDSIQYTVIGVLEDFHYYDFYQPIEPVAFIGLGDRKPEFITVRTKPGAMLEVDAFMKAEWLNIAPYEAYERQFQEDVFKGYYQDNRANNAIVAVITICAMILACLGLYGLLSFNIQKKLKEFSIRKVLGASPKNIISIASKQYSWIVLIAFVLGAPLGILLMSNLIYSIFPDPLGLTPFPFVASFLLIVGTLSLTVAGQVMKAIRVNPSTNLRNE